MALAISALPACAQVRPNSPSQSGEELISSGKSRLSAEGSQASIPQSELKTRTKDQILPTAYLPDDEPAVDESFVAGKLAEGLPPVPSGSYTLAELEQAALQNNPTLAQSQANLSAAHGRHLQAGLYPNPMIGYQGSEIGNEGHGGQEGIIASQEFVTANKLGLSQEIVDEDINRLGWENETQRYRVLTSVRQGFYEVLIAQRQIELSEQLLAISEKGVEAAEALYNAKQGNKVDLLQARVEANNARISLQTARNRLQASWTRLATNLGTPQLPSARLIGEVEEQTQQLEREQALQQILATSPELAAALAKVDRARAAVNRACVEPIPNVDVQVGAQYDYASQFTIAQAQVGFFLPVHNRNQGNIQAAECALVAAHREVERVTLDIENRFASVLERYQNAQAQIERFRQQILPDASESLKLVTEGYRQGELDYLRYLTAQRTNFQTNVEYLSALRAWWSSRLELEGALLIDGLRAPATD